MLRRFFVNLRRMQYGPLVVTNEQTVSIFWFRRSRRVSSIRLPFVRAHVAALVVFVLAGALTAALVGRQQMTLTIGAPVRVARVNR